jgi:hypothetical protein
MITCGWQWVHDYSLHARDTCDLPREHAGEHVCSCGASLPIQYNVLGKRLYII